MLVPVLSKLELIILLALIEPETVPGELPLTTFVTLLESTLQLRSEGPEFLTDFWIFFLLSYKIILETLTINFRFTSTVFLTAGSN